MLSLSKDPTRAFPAAAGLPSTIHSPGKGSGAALCARQLPSKNIQVQNTEQADAFVPTLNGIESIRNKGDVWVLLVAQDWSGLVRGFFFVIATAIFILNDRGIYKKKEGYNVQAKIWCAYERVSL